MRILITYLLIFICSCLNLAQLKPTAKLLGEGSYGKVFTNTQDTVLKQSHGIFESKKYLAGLWHLLKERNRMRYLSKKPHPNVVDYIGFDIIKNGLVIRKIEGASLNHAIPELLGSIKQNSELFIALKERIEREANAGLEHLNKNGIRHNDVYDRNIMLTRKTEDIINDLVGKTNKERVANSDHHMTKEEAIDKVNRLTEPDQPLVKVIDLGKSTMSYRPVRDKESYHIGKFVGYSF